MSALEKVTKKIVFIGEGTALVKFGKVDKNGKIIRTSGNTAIKTKIFGTERSDGRQVLSLLIEDKKETLKYLKNGVYGIVGTQKRVRFYNIKGREIILKDKPKPVSKKTTKKNGEITCPSSIVSCLKIKQISTELPILTNILIKFAEKIDKDFNLMSVCDVTAKLYAEDYVKKEIMGQIFDLEAAVSEFEQFLEKKAAPSLTQKIKKSSKKTSPIKPVAAKKESDGNITFTQKDYDMWFKNGRKGPLVADLRIILQEKGLKEVKNKTTKKDMEKMVLDRLK